MRCHFDNRFGSQGCNHTSGFLSSVTQSKLMLRVVKTFDGEAVRGYQSKGTPNPAIIWQRARVKSSIHLPEFRLGIEPCGVLLGFDRNSALHATIRKWNSNSWLREQTYQTLSRPMNGSGVDYVVDNIDICSRNAFISKIRE